MIKIPLIFIDIDLDTGSEEVYDNIIENTELEKDDNLILGLSDNDNVYLFKKEEIKKIVNNALIDCSKYCDDKDRTYWYSQCADKIIYNLFVNKLDLDENTRYFEALMDYVYELQIEYNKQI